VAVGPKLIQQLDSPVCWNGESVSESLRQRIRREYQRLVAAQQDLRILKRQQRLRLKSEQSRAVEKIRKLQRLSGIAMRSSWVFVMEFFGWRQFRNRREVGGAVGITPMPYQRGARAHEQGLRHAGHR